MKQNKWKAISGYDYEVSIDGRVRSIDKVLSYLNKNGKSVSYKLAQREKVIKTRHDGYKSVNLWKGKKGRNFLIHRPIALAFIPNPHNKPHINHKDGNPSNNAIDNLEWCTHQENMQHAHDTGLNKARKGNDSPIKKAIIQSDLNGKIIKRWECIRVAARELNIKHYCIVNVCAGRDFTYKGYKWKYAA